MSEEINKGIHLNTFKYQADGRDLMGMMYRAYDHIEEANAVIQPFLKVRKELNQRFLTAYEESLDPFVSANWLRVNEHPRKLQEYEALPWWKRLICIRPIRPTDEEVTDWKTVSDKKAELNSLIANPLMNLVAEDGEALERDLIAGWTEKGFGIHSQQDESNGEYVKRCTKMEWVK